ncbi:peptide chain release factor N(5)-glutamine methyltransferase [Lacrimispora xylanolytica]|uniref:Release factor glutamine methyltransferase n=1 Tax=Lacrimispora xylanolytica TaxID=29375 RepID=A0ABY7AHJ9_9FIRM|nr:peptide chain release factor N(5)-glutamine methyltransferase [Lacrimispora xylanolytica]WAJ26066.1 peptide chain release factor N(5)-glutamine methyltransferase [Lacrimispora xylanolytica]
MTLDLLLTEGVKVLTEAGIEEATLDARYLLFEVFHTDMTHFLLDRGRVISEDDQVLDQVKQYRLMIEKRSQRIPLQHITGSREFMGLEFYVNEHVLIPRQDTETLVELILKDYKGRKPVILDMCTGSGCIAISLSKIGGFDDVAAVDLSKEALKVAKRNADVLLGPGRITLIESDLFQAIEPKSRFDIIVSNPPYIPTEIIKELQPEVRNFEPMLALDGREDGLFFYRQLVSEGRRFLNPGGSIYFEIGYDQAESVSALLEDAGFAEIRVVKDAAGLDRVVCAVMK